VDDLEDDSTIEIDDVAVSEPAEGVEDTAPARDDDEQDDQDDQN
jgi:hypothetical protein